MKHLILVLMTLGLLLSAGCTNAPETPEATISQNATTEPTESTEATPMTELDPEDQLPTGTDSDLPGPQEGPEGLPTPAL